MNSVHGVAENVRRQALLIRKAGRFFGAVLSMFWLLALFAFPQARATVYEYDANGQLRSATNASGDSVVYDYDSLGNLLRIDRYSSNPLTVAAFAPAYGEPGVQVKIDGGGFGSTTSANDVRFNGTSAAVLAASANELLVMVPLNATSGKITVTVSGKTATSDDSFTISQIGLPPQISTFTPAAAPAGSVVTINGANFNPYPGQTTVELDGFYVPISSITDQKITFVVPAYVGSAPIVVTTAFGRSIGSVFFAVPPAISTTNIAQYPTIQPTQSSQAITFSNASPYDAMTFVATQGDYLSLQLSNFTSTDCSLTYQIYDPSNTLISSGTLCPGSQTVHLPRNKYSGLYSVYFGSAAGTNQFVVSLQKNGFATIDGGPVTFASGTGQSQRFMFSANAGDNLGIGFTNVTVTNQGTTYFGVVDPTGTLIGFSQCFLTPPGCTMRLSNLAVSGVYALMIYQPIGAAATTNATATVSHDVAGTLTPGTLLTINLPQPGQNGRFTFQATAGTNAFLQVGGVTTLPAGGSNSIQVFSPTGAAIFPVYGYGNVSATGDVYLLGNFPVSGTYTVLIQPIGAYESNLSLLLVPSSSAPAVTVDGPSASIPIVQSSHGADFTFVGTAGDNVGIGFSFDVGGGTASVYRPDGSLLTNQYAGNGLGVAVGATGSSGAIKLTNLPTSGTYSVVIDAVVQNASAVSVTISRDLAATPTPNNSLAVNLRSGQTGRFAFSAKAGDYVALSLGGVTTSPAGNASIITVLKPDGTTLTTTYMPGNYVLDLPNLPAAGTYTVLISPNYAVAATFNLTLVAIQVSSIPVDGTAESFDSTPYGNYDYFTFSASAGGNFELAIRSLVSDSAVLFYVYNPDGTILTSIICNPGVNCNLVLSNLPQSGAYKITSDVYTAQDTTKSAQFSVKITPDAVSTLTSNSLLNISLKDGQNGRYTFSGTSGSTVVLDVGAIVTTPTGNSVQLSVLQPNGTVLDGSEFQGGYGFYYPKLPATGTYTLLIKPDNGAATTASLLLMASQDVAVAVDGATRSISAAPAGTKGYFSFSASAGDNVGIGVNNIASPGQNAGDQIGFTVYSPDGSFLTNNSIGCYVGSPCSGYLSNLPQSGTYSVFTYALATFNVTLSHDFVTSLTSSTPKVLNLSRLGQMARLTFSATAGMSAALEVGGVTTSPSGGSLGLTVTSPDGTRLPYISTPIGYTINLPKLPVTGTYALIVDPGASSSTTATITFIPSQDAAVAVGGSSRSISTNVTGEFAYFTFSGTTGDNLGVGITNLVETNGTGTYLNFNVYDPDGIFLTTTGCYPSNGGCDINVSNLTKTGVYSVLAQSPTQNEPNLTMSFVATVSKDVAAPMAANALLQSVSVTRVGQNARLSFSVTSLLVPQVIVVNVSNTVPSGRTLALSVLAPDGSVASSTTTKNNVGILSTTLQNPGTYTLFVDPQLGATTTFSATLQ